MGIPQDIVACGRRTRQKVRASGDRGIVANGVVAWSVVIDG